MIPSEIIKLKFLSGLNDKILCVCGQYKQITYKQNYKCIKIRKNLIGLISTFKEIETLHSQK